MNRLSLSILLLAVTGLTHAVPGSAVRCDLPAGKPTTVVASNCMYEVAVSHGLGGAFTAGTGPEHPVTARFGSRLPPILGGALFLSPSNAVSVRSWGSRTDYYLNAPWDVVDEDQGFVCLSTRAVQTPEVRDIVRADGQVIGAAARTEIRERGDQLEVEARVVARGESFEDSAVEITTTVRNLGPDEARVGVRYLYPFEVYGQSQGAMGIAPPEPPVEPWENGEREWARPGFDRFYLSVTDTPSIPPPWHGDFHYFGGASMTGPWPLDPAPTPPDRFVFGPAGSIDPKEKFGPSNVCFDWHIHEPPIDVPTGALGMSTLAYFWGDTEDNAIVLAPGESTTVTQWVWAFRENPVACEAGSPYPPAECEGEVTSVPLDGTGSHTVEGNPLLYRWSSPDPAVGFDDPEIARPEALLPGVGAHPVRLDVGIGPYVRDCEAEIEVVDTTPPELEVPEPVVLRLSEWDPDGCEVEYEIEGEALDLCAGEVPVSHTTDPPLGTGGAKAAYAFPLGTTKIRFTAEDPYGNKTTGETSVTVIDDVAPRFEVLEAEPSVLWPPNHKLVPVTVQAETGDNCDPSPEAVLVEAASSEPDDARGDGHTLGDIQEIEPGTPDFELLLRAERDGREAGRTYTLRYSAHDDSGNIGEGEARVLVPHDQG